jgi:cytochrome c-type biogenesis protein CcmH
MTFVYIIVASIALSLLVLWGLGKYAANKSTAVPKVDVASALRDLLLAKAEGRIDQAEFDRQQAVLHAAVLDPAQTQSAFPAIDKKLGLIAGAVVVVIAVVAIWMSSPSSVDAPKTAAVSEQGGMPGAPHAQPGQQANSGGDLGTVVKKLADKMEKDPNNGEGWLLLAKTYSELRRHPEADAAYTKASALVTLDAQTLADWADAHVMTKDRKWDDEGRKIVKRAVAADGKNVKALALAGSEAFDRADYKGAIDFWKRMKAVAAPDSMDAKLADANIAEANSMLTGKKPAANATPTAGKDQPAVAIGAVAGVVTLSPKLKGKVSADDTVFVVAKAPDGSGAPLAVGRYKGADFPIEFRLDDNSAIMPGRNISQFSEVLVTAKVSKSGSADASKGDLTATPVKARLGNTTLVVELNSER